MIRLRRARTFAKLTSCAVFVALMFAVGSGAQAVGFAGSRAALRFAASSSAHGANHFVLRRVGANLRLLDADTGKVLRSVAFARTSAVSISGTDGRVDNTLTLDFSGGSLAVRGGISYRGGRGGYNVLALRGGRFAHERDVAHSPHSGLIVLGDTTIRYAQIAPITDTTVAASDAITAESAAETINVVNGPTISGTQTTQVNSSNASFELVNFANKASVTINGGGGGDTFDLNSTTPAVGLASLALDSSVGASSTFNVTASTVALSLVGHGSDVANIGAGGSAQSITAPVAISDPPDFIAVNVNDSANASSSRFVTLNSADTISGLDPSTISMATTDLASITIRGGSAGNTFVLSGATGPTGLAMPINLSTGTGVDSTFVQGVAANTSVTIHGQNGNDGVSVSNAGTVQGILGQVTVDNTSAFTSLVIDDSNDTTARVDTLASDGTTDTVSGVAPANISAKASALDNFTVDGGSGGNTLTLTGLRLGETTSTATLNTGTGADTTNVQPTSSVGPGTLNINGQAGNDTVRLGNTGSVQQLTGAVNITNGAATDLTVNDASDPTARAVTVGATALTGLAPATIAYSGVHPLTVDGGTGGNAFAFTGTPAGVPVTLNTGTGADTTTVAATSSPLTINGQAGSDSVKVGGAGSVQSIGAPVIVDNGGGATALTVDDSSDTFSRAVAVGTTAVTGLAPAAINYTDVPALTIDGGGPNDTFAVTPAATTTDTVVGGGPASTTPPGNALNMTMTGATSPGLSGTTSAAGAQGTWTFANRSPVNFSHMQSLNPTGLSVADAATTVGARGGPPLTFAATLLAPSALPVSASYATADGTATSIAGAYLPASGTVSFPAGTTSQTLLVTALGQPTAHPLQTLALALSAPVNAVLNHAVATGTIIDSVASAPPASVAPVITHLTQTHTNWRTGTALARIASRARRRAPVGTTFSFRLNESAGVTLAFTQRVRGRRTHGRCAVQTSKNRKDAACQRTVTRGTLRMTAHAGTDHITFQGRLSHTRGLHTGRYTLVLTAIKAAVQRSRPSTIKFTIVK